MHQEFTLRKSADNTQILPVYTERESADLPYQNPWILGLGRLFPEKFTGKLDFNRLIVVWLYRPCLNLKFNSQLFS